MAADIQKVKNANPIRNGSVVVTVDQIGNGQVLTDRIKPNQVIEDIATKHDNRFDDVGYYG